MLRRFLRAVSLRKTNHDDPMSAMKTSFHKVGHAELGFLWAWAAVWMPRKIFTIMTSKLLIKRWLFLNHHVKLVIKVEDSKPLMANFHWSSLLKSSDESLRSFATKRGHYRQTRWQFSNIADMSIEAVKVYQVTRWTIKTTPFITLRLEHGAVFSLTIL